ncbi:MAG: hypothetical protein GC162_19945 [Planctomycetes bacterium]|nr:hypothetical protein [Planctomycetota bacterium]
MGRTRWWQRIFGAGRTEAAGDSPRGREQARRYLCATEAASAAQRAIEAGDVAGAERAIDSGLAHDVEHGRLWELAAHVKLAQGQAPEAIRILELSPGDKERRRLLTALAMCQSGQVDAARLDLRQWSRCKQCPSEGRALLAWLELRDGDVEAARRALHRNLKDGADALTCQMLVVIDVAEDLPQATRRAAGYLAHVFARDEEVGRWLNMMEMGPRLARTEAPQEMIEQLAHELLRKPQVIGSLAAAQKIEPAAGRMELLRRALVRVVDDLPEPMVGIEALAMLSEAAGDFDDARRWARRGLREEPYSATLALLIDRLEDVCEDDAQGPRALAALRNAATARPEYADVRYALIRRYGRLGMKEQARRLARQWHEREPDNQLAQRAESELAA